MPTLAVVAISARAMAEAAARDGFGVVALDLFGDLDTRRAASRWLPIGAPGSLRIDAARTLAALRDLSREPDPVIGWVAGSGFEGEPDLLEQGAAILPLIGTAAAAVRRLRDPALFFGFLAAQGIPHPQVSFERLEKPEGWLMKDAQACGGWHVRRPPWPVDVRPAPGRYYQHEMAGQPMSATFIANGRDVHVLGFNELMVCRLGARHFVFRGVVGPVPIAPDMAHRLTAIARTLTVAFELRGLCSLDFMRDGEAIGVLEVNPRPPASMSLYAPGLMRAHARACLNAQLPPARPGRAPGAGGMAGGMEIVFAPRPLQLDAAAARQLAAWPGIHDLPGAGQRFDAGDPLCTLSVNGRDAAQVRRRLDESRERLLQSLETLEVLE
jgi:predicted ATP-grasp superfamily ATP-dependent carboligase